MTRIIPQLAPTIFIGALAAACANPKRIDERPITTARNGDRIEAPTRAMDAATTQALEARIEGHQRRDSLTAVAWANCSDSACAAMAHAKVAIGMTEAQMLAATQSTGTAWTTRTSGSVAVMIPRDENALPRDAQNYLAMVQMANGRVASFTYREAAGLYTVTGATDPRNANAERAAMLVAQGDEMAGAGDFTAALDRYDRASILNRADPEIQFRIATSLDKLLRPVEAQLRYKLFLNQLEIQKIDAVGNANAKLAAAMVQARERLVVLEKK